MRKQEPQSGYPGCRRDSGYEWFALALKTNYIRQPKRQVPSSSYNHNTLTTLRTSVRESPACTKSMEVPYCNLKKSWSLSSRVYHAIHQLC